MLCGSFCAACVGVSFAIAASVGGGLASGGDVAGGVDAGGGGDDVCANAGHDIAIIRSIGENFMGLSMLVPTADSTQDFLRGVFGRCAGTAVDGSLPDAAAQMPQRAPWTKDVVQGLCARRPRPGSPSASVVLACATPSNRYGAFGLSFQYPSKQAVCRAIGRKLHGPPANLVQVAGRSAKVGPIVISGPAAGGGGSGTAVASAWTAASYCAPGPRRLSLRPLCGQLAQR